jgi:hypothetical protein
MGEEELRMELAELERSLEQWAMGNLTTIERQANHPQHCRVWRHRIRDIKRELASNEGSARSSL